MVKKAKKQSEKKVPWKSLAEEVFDESQGQIQKASISETPEKEKILGLQKFYKGKNGPIPRRGKGFWIPIIKMPRLVEALMKLAAKIGIKIKEPTAQKEIGAINEKLMQLRAMVIASEQEKYTLLEKIQYLQKDIEQRKIEILKKNYNRFEKDIEDLETLIEEATLNIKKEEDIQKFLKKNPWFFGLEFHRVEPKKLAGSKDEFDFYLTNYSNQGIIVELKRPSDEIFKEDYKLSTKLGEVIGQTIRYMEDTVAIAHSVYISEREGLYEKKPLAQIAIGRTKNTKETERVKVLNSYLHRIEILSYDDILRRAKTILKSLDK